VGKKVMDEKQPLYVEPEERDEVTDAAAAITAAATGVIPRLPAEGDAGEAAAEADDGAAAPKAGAGASDQLTLAERLGLRAPGGPREGDDEQEVGPTR
jgi:cell division transport system ATP-binding protein